MCAVCNTQCEKKGKNGWDLDHKIPLIEGDGSLSFWQMGNLQTLCKQCHKDKTSREATERATRRREMKVNELFEGEVVKFPVGADRPGKKVNIETLINVGGNKLVVDTLDELGKFLKFKTSVKNLTIFDDEPSSAMASIASKADVHLINKSDDAVKKFAADLKAKFPKLGAKLSGQRIALKFTSKGSHFIGSYFTQSGAVQITLVLKT